jgi:hypothetical protein
MTFSTLREGATVYVVEGVRLDPIRFDAKLSAEERAHAKAVVGFGAVLDHMSCRLRWHGRPVHVEA